MSDTTASPTIGARLGAETLGTFWLVFGGAGTVVFAGGIAEHTGDRVAVALAFGLTVLTGIYTLGRISGAHFNPAVTIGMAVGHRFDWKDVPAYIAAQVVGGTIAGAIILLIAEGHPGFTASGHMGTNGYGDGGYSLFAVLVAEIVLTAMFVYVNIGATGRLSSPGFAGIAIGLCLTLIHLIAIPIDGTSVNPARSLGVAWFGGGHALGQVWLFIVAPIIGAVLAGATHALITGERD